MSRPASRPLDHGAPLRSPNPDTASQSGYNYSVGGSDVAGGGGAGGASPMRRSFVSPTTEGDQRHVFGQGRPMAKDASGSGASWYQGTLSAAQNANQNIVESRLFFTGTTGMSGGLDLSRSTDAREKGRLGLFGTSESYAGSYGRVTSEPIGRDLNPLGRGDGFGYVAGALLVARLAPWLPKNIALSGTGNSVNNQTPGGGGGGGGWPTLTGATVYCPCCPYAVAAICYHVLGDCGVCDSYLIAHSLWGCCTPSEPAGMEDQCRAWRCDYFRCIAAAGDPCNCGFLLQPLEKVLSECQCDEKGGGGGGARLGPGPGGGVGSGGGANPPPPYSGCYLAPGPGLYQHNPSKGIDCLTIVNAYSHSGYFAKMIDAGMEKALLCLSEWLKNHSSSHPYYNDVRCILDNMHANPPNHTAYQYGGCCCTGKGVTDLKRNCCPCEERPLLAAYTCAGHGIDKYYAKIILCPALLAWLRKISRTDGYKACLVARELIHETGHRCGLTHGGSPSNADLTEEVMSCCSACPST